METNETFTMVLKFKGSNGEIDVYVHKIKSIHLSNQVWYTLPNGNVDKIDVSKIYQLLIDGMILIHNGKIV